MSDLKRAVDAELRAFEPEQTPPFSVVLDRRRARARRRTTLVVAAAAAVALLVLPVAWWTSSAGDQLVQVAGPPGDEPRAVFSAHQVVDAAPREAATGSVQTPAADGAVSFPGGYACGVPAPTPPADGGLVACTGEGLGDTEILRLAPAALTSSAVRGASVEPTPAGGLAWQVIVALTPDATRAFQELTGAAACAAVSDPGRRIAFVVDGVVLGVPLVSESVVCDEGIDAGSVQLVLADATEAEAQELARRLTPR